MRPSIIPAPHWNFPRAQQTTLENGLQVMCLDMPGQQLAAIELALPTPTSHEPKDLMGVATIALTTLDEGTREHPDGRINELLELQGATLSASTSHEGSRLTLDAPANRMESVLELLAEILSDPQYAPGDIAQHVEYQQAGHEARLSSPTNATREILRTALFPPEVREWHHAAGTPETLEAITPTAVQSWHDRFISPVGATFVIAGDFSELRLPKALEVLNRWQGGAAGAYQVPVFNDARTVVADLPHAVQASIQMVAPVVGRDHPDWAALRLAGHALVGAFASRLNLELRERRGLTYGVHGGFSPHRRGSRFLVGANLAPDGTAAAIQHVLREITLETAFSSEEIDTVRQYLTGVGPLANETASDVAHQAATLALAEMPVTWVDDQIRQLLEPSAEDVTEAMRRHLQPENLTIAIGAPADEICPGLDKAGIAYQRT